jgi:pimeloyl-ACP methyl ester carboxylesterase
VPRTELLVNGFRVPVSTFGDGATAPLLVCVNAGQQTMGAWGLLAKRFMRRGVPVALFDFPNQGSSPTADCELDLLEQGDLTAEVARQLSPERPVALIGGSWGSLVAAACAARHPELVSHLVLGSFQARTHPRLQRVSQLSLEVIERGVARQELAELVIREFGGGLPESFQDIMRKQFAALSDAQLEQSRWQCAMVAAGGDLRDLVDLGRITGRVLVVNGANDPLVDPADHESTVGCFRHAETLVVPGVGHFLHQERPSLIDIFIDFVRSGADGAGLESPAHPSQHQEAPMMSELQTRKLTHLFRVFDADRNDYLEPEDARRLVHGIARARGLEPGSGQYEALQRRYQESMAAARPFADPAGRLDLAGFLRFHHWLLNTPGAFQTAVQRLAELVFFALDEDGDGEVTREEARLFYAAHGLDRETADAVFTRIDLDSDGFLTQAEAADIVTQFYYSSDPDVPGNWLFGPFER